MSKLENEMIDIVKPHAGEQENVPDAMRRIILERNVLWIIWVGMGIGLALMVLFSN